MSILRGAHSQGLIKTSEHTNFQINKCLQLRQCRTIYQKPSVCMCVCVPVCGGVGVRGGCVGVCGCVCVGTGPWSAYITG